MNTLGRYMQVHLSGAAAGIDLFALAQRRIADPPVSEEIRRIREELLDERARLVRMAEHTGAGDSRLLKSLARLGAQLTLLGPRGNWMRRAPVTELALLEAMRDAVAGKIAGWQALLTVVEEHAYLDRDELQDLLAQGERQLDVLSRAHTAVAERVLGTPGEN